MAEEEEDPSSAQLLLRGANGATAAASAPSDPQETQGASVDGVGWLSQSTLDGLGPLARGILGLSSPSNNTASSAPGGGPPATQPSWDSIPNSNMFNVPEPFNDLPPDVARSSAFYQHPEWFSTERGRSIYPDIFDTRKNPSTGWFRMEDYKTPGHSNAEFQTNNQAWSTNDWRLLGNDPDKFMVNGRVISRSGIAQSLASADESTGSGLHNVGGATGFPIGFTTPGWAGVTSYGYPGALSGWMSMGSMSQTT